MEVYSIEEKMFPLNRPIIVYLYNIREPKWDIDEFYIAAKSDGQVVTGFGYYLHNVSHWCELPEVPTCG